MAAPFVHTRSGRSRPAALVLAAVWAGLAALWLWLDAAPWIVLGFAAFTLPVLWDLIADPPAGLTLDEAALRWHSGRRSAEVRLDEIDHMRLDTRLDFSVRATLVLKRGGKVRLPFEATPPHRAFEEALVARGLRVKRFHFQLMQ